MTSTATTAPATREDARVPPAQRIRSSPAQRIGVILRTVILWFGAVLFLIPFYLLLRNGLATDTEMASRKWTFFPTSLHWENFGELFTDRDVNLLGSMWTTAVMSVLQTAGTIVISMMAGYGLTRIPYRFAGLVSGLVLVTLMIPAAVTFVPTFVIVSTLGWVNSLRGLIIPGVFSALAVFLFRQQYTEFPKELEEAGRIDGLGYFGTFWRIVVPNTLPFTMAIATITFLGSWNSFLWPLVIGQEPKSWTVQVALSSYLNSQSSNIALLFLGSVVAILPVLLIFVFLQRYIRQGVESTGITG